MVSRVKYPQYTDTGSGQTSSVPPAAREGTEPQPADVELVRNRQNITASLRALVEKYSLAEITLATEDGLVFASSSDHDVQLDAVKFSQIMKHQAPPDEPDVTLFELLHRESRLVGILRRERELPPSWKRMIRDDTKAILQWWL